MATSSNRTVSFSGFPFRGSPLSRFWTVSFPVFSVRPQPETPEDGYSISRNNANLIRLPAAFLSDDEEALDSVLFAYNGRAIVDSRSLLPEERLEEIARRYGAVVI